MGIRVPGIKCGACGGKLENERSEQFCGVPVCQDCHKALGLGTLVNMSVPPPLSDLIDAGGKEAASGLGALASRMPRGEGWKLLSNVHGMTMTLKDQPSRELLRGSLILVGSTVIGSGTELSGGEIGTRALTLSLVLGEVVCLSIMRRISKEAGLTSTGRLDDVLITARFRSQLTDVLYGLRSTAVPDHENELASAVWTLLG